MLLDRSKYSMLTIRQDCRFIIGEGLKTITKNIVARQLLQHSVCQQLGPLFIGSLGEMGGVFQGIEFCNRNTPVERRVHLCIFCCMISEIREVQIYFLFSLKIVLIHNKCIGIFDDEMKESFYFFVWEVNDVIRKLLNNKFIQSHTPPTLRNRTNEVHSISFQAI